MSLLLVALPLLVWLISAAEMVARGRHLRRLRDLPSPGGVLPSLTVVLAARNEAGSVEPALRSLLATQYATLRVVAVNDRSTDATGAILDAVAADEPRLEVVHVEALPEGWLGKNHALSVGAARAESEWLLFTDADIHFHPEAVARAVAYAGAEELDHLAVAPGLLSRGVAMELFSTSFALVFAQLIRPWRARDPRSRRHIGIGAFNLVRRAAYVAAGGHAPIRMRPDDDLQLGRLLKSRGFRQDVAMGAGMVTVEWYATLGEAVRGLEKNSFAAFDYSLARASATALSLFALTIGPFAVLPWLSGPALLVNLGTVAFLLLLYAATAARSGANPLLAPAFPLALLLIFWTGGRATALTLLRGGIRWRDTFYPLAELRANRL
jgi:cellulose synthase/poly-beta-1,6-N-acetylglucosamine synthase-like glycosyltransferase